MRLETFFEKFEQFADAPNAVAKMRELVLQLGVTGKLFSYADSNNNLWRIAPLGEVARLRRGYDLPTQSRHGGDILIYAANGTVGTHNEAAVKGPGVVTGRSGSIGKVHFAPVDFWPLNTALYVEDFFGNDPQFVCLLLRSLHLEQFSTCTAVPTLNRNVVHKEMVRVPPVAEQKRIVAKVDELMALCDRLEVQQQERATRHAALARAALARFADAPTPANLNFLFHPSYAIAPSDIRKAILTLAVQGKLVPQDPDDEDGGLLLKKINDERLEGVKSRLISPMKMLPPVADDELAFDVRPGWVVARLIELVMEIQTGPFGSSLHKSDYQFGGTPVINPASLKDGKIVAIDAMAIGDSTLKRLKGFKLRAGDIVMARRGEMGRCAIVTENEAGWLCGTGSLVLRMPRLSYAPYVAMLIGAPEAREYLGGASVGTTMQNLNQTILAKMPVGVPPLAEQRRIVAKVDQLMTLVDQLEAQLAASRTAASKLMEAVVAELTAVTDGK